MNVLGTLGCKEIFSDLRCTMPRNISAKLAAVSCSMLFLIRVEKEL